MVINEPDGAVVDGAAGLIRLHSEDPHLHVCLLRLLLLIRTSHLCLMEIDYQAEEHDYPHRMLISMCVCVRKRKTVA